MDLKTARQDARVSCVTRIMTAFAVSASFAAGWQTVAQETDPSGVANAFGLDFARPTCLRAAPAAAHLEEFSTLFFQPDADGHVLFQKHAQTAAGILWDRANRNASECLSVKLLDVDPFAQNKALAGILSQYDVVSISTFISQQNSNSSPPSKIDNKGNADFPLMLSSTEMESSFLPGDIWARRKPYEKHSFLDAAFWQRSDTIIVRSVSNEGDEPDKTKRVTFHAIDAADNLIVVGAFDLKRNRAMDYSAALAPDFLAVAAFAQGFCYPYYATATEIGDFVRYFHHGTQSQPDRDAGKPVCDKEGTSFVAPDIAGSIARARRHFPGLTALEITAAAYLATSAEIGPLSAFKKNARGLPFDAKKSGHGAFLPFVFSALLTDLDNHKKRTGAGAVKLRLQQEGASYRNLIRLIFQDNARVLRTIGHLSFDKKRMANGDTFDSFPATVRVTSPSGISYDVPLQIGEENDACEILGKVCADFSVSAWMGELAAGAWTIRATRGYTLAAAKLEQTGSAPARDDTLKWLIRHAQHYLRTHPEEQDRHMDPSPWAKDSVHMSMQR